MCRSVVVLFGLVALSSISEASQPGQPLDCSDMVFLEPGYSCELLVPTENQGTWDVGGTGRAIDNEGRLLAVCTQHLGFFPHCGDLNRTEILRLEGNSVQTIGYIDDRLADCQTLWPSAPHCVDTAHARGGGGICYCVQFDPLTGRLLFSSSWPAVDGLRDPFRFSISGFSTLFDVIDSYVPTSGSLGFRVPNRPDALRAADRFDTYWGNVTKPLDLAQAHPLQCAYPDHQPQVGEYLTYLDTAPTPEPGQAIYYLTSVTYQGQTRAGRKALDGWLSGRDATSLPPCVPPSETAQGNAEPSRNSL